MTRRKLLFVFLTLMWGAAPLMAGVTGKIAGRVTDAQSGEPLVGANIMLIEKIENGEAIPIPSSRVQGAAADMNGEYFIINVKPGVYSVRFMYMGYQAMTQTNILVNVDRTTTLDCQMSVTVLEAAEAVVVTAQRKQIKKDLTSSEVSVSSDKIDELPVRSVNEIVNLQAGVVKDAGGNLHIRGGRSSEITYMVDGVQIIDPINRSSGITIDDQSIAELKTITGTFNAEYGQALSGVVNIVTKQGSDKFKMNVTGYLGDYLSFDDDTYFVMDNADWANAAARALTYKGQPLFYNFDGVDPTDPSKSHLKKKGYLRGYNPAKDSDFQVNLSGPLPLSGDRVSYFLSGRYQYGPGYVYGKRYFMPWGFQAPAGDTLNSFKAPDGELVPLSWSESLSTQSKLFFRLSSRLNMSYGFYFNRHKSFGAGYGQKYVPDAGTNHLTQSQTHILSLRYVQSNRTFWEMNVSRYIKDYEGYLYKDPYDYRYMPTKAADIQQYVYGGDPNVNFSSNNNDFSYYGNNVDHSYQDVDYTNIKLDMTSQITKRHLIKMGASATLHDLKTRWYQLQFSDYRPIIPDEISPFHVTYEYNPTEFAAYIQDKIEFNELIINLGVRFDYFDSDGIVLADPADPQIYRPFHEPHIWSNYTEDTPDSLLVEYTVDQRREFWYEKAKPKYQISPRFGVSFPITEHGVIHFSYGHFFQNPQLSYLYANPNFWIEGAGASNLIGNADINAERTVMYEVGLQQQLFNGFYLHLTGFYRDIRDWVGTGTPIDTYYGITYYKYVNKDLAAAKGVTVSANYRSGDFNLNVDYTLMSAKGTSSNPQDAYYDAQEDRAPRIQMINLNWDQQHTFNTVLNYSKNNWTATMIGTINSGLPYTPSFSKGEVSGSGTFVGLRENSERRPMTYNVDLRIARSFRINKFRFQLFCNITNLLDTRNAVSVFSDTGQPDFTLQGKNQIDRHQTGYPDAEISNTQEFFTRPWNYSAPRFIQLGFRLSI